MTRIAIIDHISHTLYVEDLTEEDLKPYNGEEQLYIEDNFSFKGEYSWDYIIDAEYYSAEDKEPIEIHFTPDEL